jgi:uncharacterized protein YbbC (DUF1343 family)
MHRWSVSVVAGALGLAACAKPVIESGRATERVRPGITVLLDDSLGLIRGKRVGLITNQNGVDAAGVSDIDLLRDARARTAGVTLVRLFAPEHGIRGIEDRENVENGVDERTGLRIHSLYTAATIGPPDSLMRDMDALVFDLQDIGTRTWTYVGLMIYSLRAAARHQLPIVVLDRPNPITGQYVDGLLLDTALSNPEDPTPQRAGKAYALYPFPLRHGMTMGELARFYNTTLNINARLQIVPAAGWRRSMWFDETGLPWGAPSPNIPTLTSALVYPSLVAFEGTNVSVGRGTPDAFQRFGAPWMDAERVAALLNARGLRGVRFVVDPFTPLSPGDGKYKGLRIPGVRIDVTTRNDVQPGRISAAILWALLQTNRDSLVVRARAFDERFGSTAAREAIMSGADPDVVMQRQQAAVQTFLDRARRFRIYQ